MLPENHNCLGVKATDISHWIRHEDRFKKLREEVRGSLLGGESTESTSKTDRRSDQAYSERRTLTDKGRQAGRGNQDDSTRSDRISGRQSKTDSNAIVIDDERGRVRASLLTLISYLILPFFLLFNLLRAIVAPVATPRRLLVLTLAIVIVASQLIVAGAFSATDVIGTAGEPVDELAQEGTEYAAGLWANVTNGSREAFMAATNGSNATTDSTNSEDNGGGLFSSLGNELDSAEIERLVHAEVNERRQAHGLDSLNHDSTLRQVARGHADLMAENGELFHTQPDGDTLQDRYRQTGFECRIRTGSGTYSTGAENVAKTWYQVDVISERGTVHYNTPDELATGIVNQLMNSTGHRDNILKPYWQNEGIGVSIEEVDGNTAVFVTQDFC